MSWTCWALLCAALGADLPAVEVQTLKGEHYVGRLASLNDSDLNLVEAQQAGQPAGTDGKLKLSVTDLLEVRFPDTKPAEAAPEDFTVTLVDGSRLSVSAYSVAGAKAKLTDARLGDLSLAANAISHVRLGAAEPKFLDAWTPLLEKESKRDLLVLRKGEVLDFLAGVIGDVDDKTVKFLVDTDEVPVKRERVYGLIYRRPAGALKSSCQIDLAGLDALHAKKLSFDGETWQATLAQGPQVKLPAGQLRTLDYSLGRLRYLSQMEPREVKYLRYFDDGNARFDWPYQRDRGFEGEPLKLNGVQYTRGLAIHSYTQLRYRLGGDYRRFSAVMGIDDSVRGENGNVNVTILGDGKELFRGPVKDADAPRNLDLDVAGVRELEITVDFGENIDIADRLDLADCKVIK
ncbi:MAG TPA: NPCBM/NEW2 domain-containing protein [Planctomycetaceae bacterium]|nr:NPCBM/NEW2 domain-containing protein [Planctomycetaceae bacterium]